MYATIAARSASVSIGLPPRGGMAIFVVLSGSVTARPWLIKATSSLSVALLTNELVVRSFLRPGMPAASSP
jgi:hypothetical protein